MRIGSIGFCDPGYAEDAARAQYDSAVNDVRASVSDIVDVGLQPDERTSSSAVMRLVRENAEHPFDALLLVQAAWARPDVLLQVVRAMKNVPMLLLAPGSPVVHGEILSTAPSAGIGSTLPILRRHGVKHKCVWSAPARPIDPTRYMPFLRACCAARNLRGMKLAMVGFGDMRLQMSGFDVRDLHETFGVEVESIDMLEIATAMDRITESELAAQTSVLTAGWNYVGKRPKPEVLNRAVAMYLVLDRWAQERNYAGLSIKCPTGVAAHMGFTPCLVGCLFARKLHYICENDIPGLLGQTILGLLSGQTSTYWELYEVLEDGILMGCCGFCPEAMLAGPLKVRSFEGFVAGMGCCSPVQTGRHTLARLGREHGAGYVLHGVEGDACEPPPWQEVALGRPQHPSVRFVPDHPVESVMSKVLSQHFAVVPGEWSESLREFASLQDVAWWT